MIIDFRSDDFGQVQIIDLNTGDELTYVLWCSVITGEYECYVKDDNGDFILNNESRDIRTIRGKTRLQVILTTPGQQ
jgi:hypothetical protein